MAMNFAAIEKTFKENYPDAVKKAALDSAIGGWERAFNLKQWLQIYNWAKEYNKEKDPDVYRKAELENILENSAKRGGIIEIKDMLNQFKSTAVGGWLAGWIGVQKTPPATT